MNTLKLEKNNFVYTMTLHRPEVRNAFNDEMISEMTKMFKSLGADPAVRVLILKGEGESFCAGGDLHWMKSMVNFSEQENREDSERLFEMYQALAEVPVPVICLTHGHAMGGGLGLMAVSDIVLAVEETKYCFSEVRLGLAPAVISHFVAKKIHSNKMSRYFLTAEVFGPDEAIAMGLAHEQGSLDSMVELANKLAKKICNNSPRAVRATKGLITQLPTATNSKKLTTELIAKLRVSSEGQEGLQAFFDKRKPNWVEAKK